MMSIDYHVMLHESTFILVCVRKQRVEKEKRYKPMKTED